MKSHGHELPAFLGGPQAVTLDHASINKWPDIDREDEDAVLQVMRDGNISTHPVIRQLEREYASFTG
ncbi:MAG: hypothetical protein ACM32I_05205, partial [Nitrospirota bacterium]